MSRPQDNTDLAKALELVSRKTGTDPAKLAQLAQQGNLSSLVSSPAAKQLLQDPKKLERLLQDPRVKSFLTNLLKGQGGNG